MNSSANVKLRYEKCLQVWGNARDCWMRLGSDQRKNQRPDLASLTSRGMGVRMGQAPSLFFAHLWVEVVGWITHNFRKVLMNQDLRSDGAGDGNRTHVICLGSKSPTIERHPRCAADCSALKLTSRVARPPLQRNEQHQHQAQTAQVVAHHHGQGVSVPVGNGFEALQHEKAVG